jgi:hypothetical protein
VNPWPELLNAAFLLLCCSMYFGTGWSMGLFSFPLRPKITVDNYYLLFVPEVTAATRFFTWMTMAMMASAAGMIWIGWGTVPVWAPVVVLVAIAASTLLTVVVILPINAHMAAGITDAVELGQVLDRWMRPNWVRITLWTVAWAAIVVWFVAKSRGMQAGGPA